MQGSYRKEGFVSSYFLQTSVFKKLFFSSKKSKTKVKYAHLGQNGKVCKCNLYYLSYITHDIKKKVNWTYSILSYIQIP